MKHTLHLLILLIVTACGTGHEHSDKMIFRYNESAGISSLDPAYSRNLENIWACNMLYNGLVEINDSLQIVPSIAKSWRIDSTGTRYQFVLRDDVRFHDSEVFPDGKGRIVVASDFVYSFQRLLDAKMSSPGSWVFGSARESYPFVALNDTVLEIHLAKPFPAFLGLLGMEYCGVVPHEAVEKFGEDFRSKPVGTGPFKINFWIENTRLVLIKNEHYFERDESGASLPYLDAVSVSFIPDKSAAFLDLLKGNFDFISGLHPSYKDELLTPNGVLNELYAKELYLQRHPFLKTDYLGFVVNPVGGAESPWQQRDLRRAVSYAIDRESMVRYLRNNVYTPASGGFIPEGMQAHNSSSGYSYQPDSVRTILKRLGYAGGKGLPELRLSTTSDYVDLCEYVQHQLGVFGIRMKVDVLPASVHRELSAQGSLEFFRKSWLADYPDDENFMALFYGPNKTPAGPNYFLYQNAEFDALYERSMNTNVYNERSLLYSKMDSLVMADAPAVVLYYDVVMRFISKKVSGLDASPMNVLDLRRVRIEK